LFVVFSIIITYLHTIGVFDGVYVAECTQCSGSAYEVRPCTPTADRHCLRELVFFVISVTYFADSGQSVAKIVTIS